MRATAGTLIAAAVSAAALLAAAAAAPAQPPRTCAWGGTPLAPTGENSNAEGITNTPSTHPIRFHATGPLSGECQGTLVFDGIMDAGASCSDISFHAHVYGLPGVSRVVGRAVGGLAPARLYDRHGDLVGSENANFLSDPSVVRECSTPQGVVHNRFDSVIELFGT